MHFSYIAFLTVAGLLIGDKPFAENTRHFIAAENIPLGGSAVSDFVPLGWRIELTVPGDLNSDADPDIVLELIEDSPATAGDTPNERSRALLVLLRTHADKFQRIALATRLLRCSTCFGMLAGPEGGGADITIANGVLVVDELWGSRQTVHTTLRFRFDPALNLMVLIVEDIERFDRATGAHTYQSSNFLTGIRLTEGSRYSAEDSQLIRIPSDRRPIIPRLKRPIEDISYEDYEQ